MKTNAETKKSAPKAARKHKRLTRNFKLAFPKTQFTIKSLGQRKQGKVSYITLYKRIEKALESGVIKKVGIKTPHFTTRGRKQIMYALAKQTRKHVVAKVKVAKVTHAPATVPEMGVRVVSGVNVNSRGEPMVAA